jgi:hypothetical protein
MAGIDPPGSHEYPMNAAGRPLPRDIILVLEEDIETSIWYGLRLIRDDVPNNNASHMEYFKSFPAKAVKQAVHRNRKNVDEIRPDVEGELIAGDKHALGLPVAVLRLISDGIQALFRKKDKETRRNIITTQLRSI